MKVVVDTNVFVSAIMSPDSAARQILRFCFLDELTPLMGNALFAEYEDVVGRTDLFSRSLTTANERQELLDAFASTCVWVPIYYLWRPNLRDEADNHVLELAVAGGASTIITSNLRDFGRTELNFENIKIQTPRTFLELNGARQ